MDETSQSDVVYCHTQDISSIWVSDGTPTGNITDIRCGGSYSSAEVQLAYSSAPAN